MDVEEQPGAGLTGVVDDRRVAVGSYAFVSASAAAADWSRRFLRRMGYDGATGVFVAIDGAVAGALFLLDEIRLETPRALRLPRKAGVERIVMLTGDRRDVAEAIGDLLGVDQVLAEQQPQDKLVAIKASRSSGSTIMVGDGVNDAPALAAADVGVAMGERGTAASSEAAGIALLIDRLDRLAEAVGIAHRSRTIAIESVVAGMGLSIAAMGAAALGYLPPLAGAVLQEAIDVAVILNALRALHVHGPREGRPALPTAELDALKTEHDELSPILERVRFAADRLGMIPAVEVAGELAGLSEMLREKLIPDERRDDAQVYFIVARLIFRRLSGLMLAELGIEDHRQQARPGAKRARWAWNGAAGWRPPQDREQTFFQRHRLDDTFHRRGTIPSAPARSALSLASLPPQTGHAQALEGSPARVVDEL